MRSPRDQPHAGLHRAFGLPVLVAGLATVVSLILMLGAPSAQAATLAWGAPTQVAGAGAMSAMSCVSSSECVFVGTGGNAVVLDPATLQTQQLSIDSEVLQAVTCTAVTVCVAVDAAGSEVTFDPTNTSLPVTRTVPIDGSASLSSVSCASATVCVALDAHGEVTFNPTTSTGSVAQTLSIDPGYTLTSVACLPGTGAPTCLAVDSNGQEFTFNPQSSTAPTPILIDFTGALSAITCPTSTLCVIADGGGRVISIDPGTPAIPWPLSAAFVSLSDTSALQAVSCLSATDCVAGYSDGQWAEGNPTVPSSWTVRPAIQGEGPNIDAVSCASATQCVLLGQSGQAFVAAPVVVTGSVDAGNATAGATATDTATLTGAGTSPSGTVAYSLYANADCGVSESGGGIVSAYANAGTNNQILNGNGTVPPSSTTGPLTVGQYSFAERYSGAGNIPSASDCTSFAIRTALTVSTAVMNAGNKSPVGTGSASTYVYDSASFGGTTPDVTPTGTVTYRLFQTHDCSGSALGTDQLALTGSGSGAHDSSIFNLAVPGYYSFRADYSGDTSYAPATGACEPFSQGTPAATASVHAYDVTAAHGIDFNGGDAILNDSVYGVAAVAGDGFGTPTGTVTYTLHSGAGCGSAAQPINTPLPAPGSLNATSITTTIAGDGSVPASNATGDLWQSLPAGQWSIQAAYSGDSVYPSASYCFAQGGDGSYPYFTVDTLSSTVTTTLHESSGTTWDSAAGSTQVSGVSVYADNTAITGASPDHALTGTVAYRLQYCETTPGNGCNWVDVPLGQSNSPTVSVDVGVDGTALGSNSAGDTWGPLQAGQYSLSASYSGEPGIYSGEGISRSFTVAKAPAAVTSQVYGGGDHPWDPANNDSTAFDSAAVSGVSQASQVTALQPAGTVSYALYTEPDYPGVASNCASPGTAIYSDPGASTSWRPGLQQTVARQSIQFPYVGEPALGSGYYLMKASYSGDSNYLSQTDCRMFKVGSSPGVLSGTLHDAGLGQAWTGAEVSSATAYDTAAVAQNGPVPTGTVTYTLYDNGSCSAAGVDSTYAADSVSLGTQSTTTSTLPAGTYSFKALYSGDANYPADSVCQTLVVLAGTTTTAVVNDHGTGTSWSGSEAVGAQAEGSSTVTPTDTISTAPGGNVTYSFYSTAGCTGSPFTSQQEPLGTNSPATSALGAGADSMQVAYSGDVNYAASSDCKNFSVAQAPSVTTSVVYDAGTSAAWAGTEQAGAGAYDTAAVTGNSGVAPTGTVTYTLYSSPDCSTGGGTPGSETLLAGLVPNSASVLSLTAGVRSYQAAYSGDGNYTASSSCQQFTVLDASSFTTNAVSDGQHNAFSGVDVTGTTAYDTATVGSSATAPAGPVSFTLYTGSSCQTAGGTPDSETLAPVGATTSSTAQSQPVGPLAAGSYSFGVTYGGDALHLASSPACVPFTVGQKTPTPTAALFDSADASWGASDVTGASVYAAATVPGAGGFTPTGAVTYRYFDGATCAGSPVLSSTKTLSDGVVPNSSTSAALAAGTYSYNAGYDAAGDPNYTSADVSCTSFTVGAAAPIVSATVLTGSNVAWTTPQAPPASVHSAATVAGIDGFTPSGTVTYTTYGAGDCTGSSVATDTQTLSTGSVPDSAPVTGLSTGTYGVIAGYSGDANYRPQTSACQQFQVLYQTATTDSSVRDGSANVWSASVDLTGSTVSDTATVAQLGGAGTPTGSVTFTLYGDASCTAQIGNPDVASLTGAGAQSTQFGPLAAGTYSLQASYGGDSANAPSTGACESFVVGTAPTTTSASALNGSGSAFGGSEVTGVTAHASATVGGAVTNFVPSGTVTYNFYSGTTCTGTPTSTDTQSLSDGSVPNSAATAPLGAGSDRMQALYSGDGNYAASASSCTALSVGKGAPSTSATVDDAGLGSAWTGGEATGATANDTATVIGAGDIVPTGTVTYTFYTNGTCTGTGAGNAQTLAGGAVPNASTTVGLAPGSYSYKMVYSGDANYDSVTGDCQAFSVAKGTPAVATVVHDASGGGVWTGAEIGGSSAYDTASVDGAGGFAPSGTATYREYANGTCSNTAASSQAVTLGGDGSVPQSTATGALTSGNDYSFQVSYSGDSNYLATTGSCEPFSAGKSTTTTLGTVHDAAGTSVWSGSETTGAAAYDTAVVSASTGTPTGTVSFSLYDNSTCNGTAASTSVKTLGQPSAATAPLPAGSYSYEASYLGDANSAASQGSCEPFTVAMATSATAGAVKDAGTQAVWAGLEITGASAYDTAAVSGTAGITPTGSVTFTLYANATCASTPLSTDTEALGTHSSTTAALAAGTYSFQAGYGGDANYSASDGACQTFTVAPAPSTTSSAVKDQATSNPWDSAEVTGASSYATATVSGVDGFQPTGTVLYSLYTGSGCAGAATTNDTETLGGGNVPRSAAFGPLAGGSYSLTATYSGDGNARSSVSACHAFTVGPAASTTSSATLNQVTQNPWAGSETTGASAQATASIGGTVDSFTPRGSVTYRLYANGACAGTAAATDQETIHNDGTVPNSTASPALAAGNHSYRASYSGDASYQASASSCQPFAVASTSSSTSLAVDNGAATSPWSGNEVTGARATAVATVNGVAGVTPTATVTYSLFTSSDCSGSPAAVSQVTLSAAVAPASAATSPLTAGTYSFRAHYSGDASYQSSDSPCRPFSIGAGPIAVTGVVYDGSTQAAWAGDELTGATAYDTATFTTTSGIAPTSFVTYALFADGGCSGPPASTDSVTIRNGVVHDSRVTGALSPGSYSYDVSYSGDTNYLPSTSACAGFTVTARSADGAASSSPAITGSTAVHSTLTCSNGNWSGNPIAFTYAWSRDGVAVPGATRESYTVTPADPGHALGCAVTAVYTGGATATSSSVPSSGSPAAGGAGGLFVPLATSSLCPKPSGHLTTAALGTVSLGLSRTETLPMMPRLAGAELFGFDTFCLSGGSVIRVAYASTAVTGLLPGAQRHELAGTAVIALTSSRFYEFKGIRPGTKTQALVRMRRHSKLSSRRQFSAIAKQRKLAGPFQVGASTWFLAPGKTGTWVMRIQHGVVQEIGVANAALTHGTGAQLRFLRALAMRP